MFIVQCKFLLNVLLTETSTCIHVYMHVLKIRQFIGELQVQHNIAMILICMSEKKTLKRKLRRFTRCANIVPKLFCKYFVSSYSFVPTIHFSFQSCSSEGYLSTHKSAKEFNIKWNLWIDTDKMVHTHTIGGNVWQVRCKNAPFSKSCVGCLCVVICPTQNI